MSSAASLFKKYNESKPTMFKNLNLDKALQSMFTTVDNVSYDLATGQMGIKTDAGLLTLGSDGVLDQNPLDFFSMEFPAFAMMTPIAQVQRGDLLVSSKKAYAFVLENGMETIQLTDAGSEEKARRSIEAMNFQGHITRFRPKKVKMMGVNDGILVVKSFGAMFGTQEGKGMDMQSLMPLLMMQKMGSGKGDMSGLMAMMAMGGLGGNQQGGMNQLMMLALLGGDNSPFK